jgi:hypothetical protein
MADYSKSKKAGSSTYPIKAIDAASAKRIEPVLNPSLLMSRFIFGIPLVSPITKEHYTHEMLEDYINRAINMVELDAQVDIFPVQRRHRLPFTKDLYEEFIYTEIPNKPILSVDKLGIVTSDGTTIYDIPSLWIDNANFIDGKINVIPFASGIAGQQNFQPTVTGGGGFLVLINQRVHDIPSYWEAIVTTGFSFDSGVPMIINELVGLKAAIMIFNNLIPQFQYSSYSLGIDGVSQSQTTQAPQLYQEIRDKYEAQYEDLVKRVKMIYNNTLIMSMV